MDTTQYADLFLTESREHVAAINRWLLELERGTGGEEPLSAIFRSVHTVKGMSATMGYTPVAELSHEMETLLDRLRQGTIPASSDLVDVLFAATDLLESTIEASVTRQTPPGVSHMVERVRALAAGAPVRKRRARKTRAAADTSSGAAPAGDWTAPAPAGEGVLLRVKLRADTPLRGVRAFLIVQGVERLGRVDAVSPPVEALQSEQFGLDFALRVSGVPDALALADAVRAMGDVESVVLGDAAPQSAAAPGDATAPPGGTESGNGNGTAAAAGPVATTADGAAAADPSTRAQRHIRVDLRRLDNLMNLIGELVITRGRLTQLAGGVDDPALADTVGQASRLISELQDEIITSRMVPVGQIFERFPRLVRDAARQLGKPVDFTIEGKDIELDRSMLDEIGDPLVHLLRNALDHGIELPAVRSAAGKPPTGRLTLSATRDRSAIAIVVADDGRGIDRDRVRAKAAEAGLLEDGVELSDDDVVKLIARPGFSTAEQVTDLSGRGVGIDAVYNRVRALGGSVDIRSTRGEGTSVTLRLPLTLAIVRSLLARAGTETYAIPMTHVRETVEVTDAVLRTLQGSEVLVLREEVLPVLRLRTLVELPPAPGSVLEQAVVLEMSNRRAVLVVDDLTAQQEIVVKQFDGVQDGLAIFGGATILGDGAPALIIDVGSLL